jgi:hypothetical protein
MPAADQGHPMTKGKTSDIQSIVRDMRDRYSGILILRSFADQGEYDDAVEAFARDGSRQDLMTRLIALGLTAGEIRWHAEYPGRRMATFAGE